jgi:hypothetical protein
MPHVVTIGELLDGQVSLEIECLDRIYLSGSSTACRLPAGWCTSSTITAGSRSPPRLSWRRSATSFRRAVGSYAEANHIAVVKLKAADRNADVMRPYLENAAVGGRSRVAAIGVAQEPQVVWTARQWETDPGKPPQFSFASRPSSTTPTTSAADGCCATSASSRPGAVTATADCCMLNVQARLRPRESSLRADRAPVGHRRRAESPGHAFGDPGPSPGRRPVLQPRRRRRNHQHEPSGPDDRTPQSDSATQRIARPLDRSLTSNPRTAARLCLMADGLGSPRELPHLSMPNLARS